MIWIVQSIGSAKNPEQCPDYDFGTRRMVLRRVLLFVIAFAGRPPVSRSSRLLTVVAVQVTGGSASDKPVAFMGIYKANFPEPDPGS